MSRSSTASRPPRALRRHGVDDLDDGMDDGGSLTELEKFERERVDLVGSPATGLGFILMKAVDNTAAGGGMATTTGTDDEEAVMAKTDAPDDDKDPDDGAPGDDVDGSGDSEDGDVKDCAKDDGPPTEAAVKAARAEYEEARRAHAAAEPGTKGADTATDMLKARAEWDKWNRFGKDEGLDGGEDGRSRWIARRAAELAPDFAKRDMDPDVGGGVDRDKLPAEDFAGKNRSFPIVTAGDVKDALQSIGQAGKDNYPAAKLKRNILRIARRKGFPVPESDAKKAGDMKGDMKSSGMKDGDTADMKGGKGKKPMCSTCKGTGKIKDGNMTCPPARGRAR